MTSSRLDLWSDALHFVQQHPWIGNGLLRLQYLGLHHENSHNFIIDILFAYGIPAGVALTAILLATAVIITRRAALLRRRNAITHVFLVWAILAFSLLEPTLFSPPMRLGLILGMGCLLPLLASRDGRLSQVSPQDG